MRILLIERDNSLAECITVMLEADAITVYCTDMANEAVDLALLYDFDLVLLDMDRFCEPILRQLRAAKVATPVIVLSSRDHVSEKVAIFANGADDHLTKPFHRDELIARIRALVRRSRGIAAPIVTFGELAIDLSRQTVEVAGTPVPLTGKELRILELLALRRRTVVTKDMLLDHLYGGRDEPEIKIIDVFICKMRKKLVGASQGFDFIETVWGRGYRLREPSAIDHAVMAPAHRESAFAVT